MARGLWSSQEQQDNTEDREAGWQSEDAGAHTEFLSCQGIVLNKQILQLLLHTPMSVQAKDTTKTQAEVCVGRLYIPPPGNVTKKTL